MGQRLTKRVRISASQACGSMPFSLAVSMSEARVAQFSAPSSCPAKRAFLRVRACAGGHDGDQRGHCRDDQGFNKHDAVAASRMYTKSRRPRGRLTLPLTGFCGRSSAGPLRRSPPSSSSMSCCGRSFPPFYRKTCSSMPSKASPRGATGSWATGSIRRCRGSCWISSVASSAPGCGRSFCSVS